MLLAGCSDPQALKLVPAGSGSRSTIPVAATPSTLMATDIAFVAPALLPVIR